MVTKSSATYKLTVPWLSLTERDVKHVKVTGMLLKVTNDDRNEN